MVSRLLCYHSTVALFSYNYGNPGNYSLCYGFTISEYAFGILITNPKPTHYGERDVTLPYNGYAAIIAP